MISLLIKTAIVNGFFFSFCIIGWSIVDTITRRKPTNHLGKTIWEFPFIMRASIYALVGMLAFSPVVVLGFVFHSPIYLLVIGYSALLLYALWNLVVIRKFRPVLDFGKRLQGTKGTERVLLLFIVLVFIFDVGVSVWVGGAMQNGDDSYVHMSKITQWVQGTVTNEDAFLGNGVVESRYQLNVLYGMYATITGMTGMETFNIWKLSLPFFRVAEWLSVFALIYYFIPRSSIGRRELAYIGMLAAPVYLGSTYVHANYPNEFVLVLLSFFLIALHRFFVKKDMTLLWIAAPLVSFTHATYALLAATFTVFALAVLYLFGRLRLKMKHWASLAAILVVLILPALATSALPNRMTAGTFSYGEPAKWHLFDHVFILAPDIPTSIVGLVVMILGLVGYVWLLKVNKDLLTRVFVGCVIVFYALIAFNPIATGIIEGRIPFWAVERFSMINRFAPIASMLGFVAIIVALATRTQLGSKLKRPVVQAIVLVSLLLVSSGAAYGGYQKFIDSRTNNELYTKLLIDVRSFRDVIKNQHVLASQGNSFLLPTVTTTNVIAIPDTNSSPVANAEMRTKCNDRLLGALDVEDLSDAGVTRVVVGNWEHDLLKLAESKPYLHEIARGNYFIVFAFKATQMPGTQDRNVCEIPRLQ